MLAFNFIRNFILFLLGFLNIAPDENAGVRDHELRQKVGEEKIRLFRRGDGISLEDRSVVA